MKGILYILYFDESDKYYVGSTPKLDRRLKQHNYGHTPTTKRFRGEPKLVFSQGFDSLIEARRAEGRVKSWKRRDYIEKIIQDGYMRS